MRLPKRCLESLWSSDNGFCSGREMAESHSPILERLRPLLSARQVDLRRTSVCDLGCGNGNLMRTLALEFPSTRFRGIERDAGRVRRARMLSLNGRVVVLKGDLLRPDPTWAGRDRFTVALVMAGYLLIGRSSPLEDWLAAHVERTIVYGYDDDLVTFRRELSAPSFPARFKDIELHASRRGSPLVFVAEYIDRDPRG